MNLKIEAAYHLGAGKITLTHCAQCKRRMYTDGNVTNCVECSGDRLCSCSCPCTGINLKRECSHAARK